MNCWRIRRWNRSARASRCSQAIYIGFGVLLATSRLQRAGWSARYGAAFHSVAFAQPLVTLEQAAGLRGVPRPLSFLLTKQQRETTSIRFLHHYALELLSLHFWLLGLPVSCRSGRVDVPCGETQDGAKLLDAADAWLFPTGADGADCASPLLALWKPYGVVTTMASQEPRNLKQFLQESGHRVVPHIGRLDKGTTGLLLLSDNGDVHRILLAQGGVPKTYVATETRSIAFSLIHRICVQLNEGRNRVVRRMFQALGLPLRQLHREAIGPLSCAKLGLVSPGQIAAVPSDQLLCLLAACQKDQKGQDAGGAWSDHGRAVYNALRCGSLLCNVRRGIQVVKVDQQGKLQLSLATGCVAYTSWQPLHESDPFPLGCTVLGAPLLAAATARVLKKRGILLNAPAEALLWPKYSGPLTVGDVLMGRKAICKAPAQASTRMLADLSALMKWLETAPAADGLAPAWWPAAEREAASAWLLKSGQPQLQLPGDAMKDFFAEVRRPLFKAKMSPVQISKPIMSVESAEVEAAQDTLVASLGADEMRAMHLTDVCLVNHPAMRDSERCFGFSASAASAAVAALHVQDAFWQGAVLTNQLSCVKRNQQGELAVVFLTCADADLAQNLADVVLE
eukprot:s1981_g2.t2